MRTGALLFLVALAGCSSTPDREAAAPPNIILIMADDLGYAGPSCYGNPHFETPHLDALAREGMRFTDFHSSGVVCSPTRAGLLTGRYQQRTGVAVVVNADPGHVSHGLALQHSEWTFAEALKPLGYATGIFGKWHLGYDVKHNPAHQGFDRFRGFVSGNIDYISHYDRMGAEDWWDGTRRVPEEGYSTHLINRHALSFIEQNRNRPFCLYVAHEAIHAPNQGPHDPPIRGPDKRPAAELSPRNDAVRQMTLAMDEGVGQIVAKVKELGLESNTLIVFISDNGGTRGNRSTGPKLRGFKGSLWEGGHRVPAIFRWPGRIPAGSTTDALAISIDLMPTLLALAGASVPAGHQLDGVDLAPVLFRQESPSARPVFWGTGRGTAMRDGPWKLMVRRGGTQLYNLSQDLKEQNDVAADYPDRVRTMTAAITRWKQDVATNATPQPGR